MNSSPGRERSSSQTNYSQLISKMNNELFHLSKVAFDWVQQVFPLSQFGVMQIERHLPNNTHKSAASCAIIIRFTGGRSSVLECACSCVQLCACYSLA